MNKEFSFRLATARKDRETRDVSEPTELTKQTPKPEPTKQTPKSTRNILWGSGFTKKVAEKTAHAPKPILAKKSETESHKPAQAIESIIPETIDILSLTPDPSQERAISQALVQRVCVINGPAGVGKTTVVKMLLHRLREYYPVNNVRYMAFTGRAATNFKRFLPPEEHANVDTMHGTLEYQPVFDDRSGKMSFAPQRTSFNPLDGDMFVLEEGGMIPIYLFNKFVDALPENFRILIIGDINQLPPVQGRSVLGFAMLNWPTYSLTQIHRQAAGDAIISNAHRILQGKMPIPASNFVIKELADGSLETLQQTIGVLKFLTEKDKFNPVTDAFIVPTNKGTLGQIHFNEKLVHLFNPVKKIGEQVMNPRILIKTGLASPMYAVGDKVMLHKNDRDRGLTNGMIGIITEIFVNPKFQGSIETSEFNGNLGNFSLEDMEKVSQTFNDHNHKADEDKEEPSTERAASHVVIVRFQNVPETVEFGTAGDFRKLSHAYAFTCHKSQGGEYPTVVILCHASQAVMLSREWLYTAVTRAQKRVIILTNPVSRRGLNHAVNCQRITGNTTEEKAQAFLALQDAADTSLPNLPEPEEIPLPIDLQLKPTKPTKPTEPTASKFTFNLKKNEQQEINK